MEMMHAGNSPAYDLADAMKGRNNTIFTKTNKHLEEISKQLSKIASSYENKKIVLIKKMLNKAFKNGRRKKRGAL